MSQTPGGHKIREWRLDPVKFVIDNFKIEPDLWQIEALKKLSGSYNPRRRIAFKSCTGAGKSTVLAWIGWHRLACFVGAGDHPKGAALSGQGRDNLRDTLWVELQRWQLRSEFLKTAFTWNKEQITANGYPTWFLSARSYPKDADSEAIGRSLSGLHSKFPFILLDEIGDAPSTLGQKASQIFTGGPTDALIAAAGNPTSVDGLLYHIATNERNIWEMVTITADPDDPMRTPRVDINHAREQIELYGRENPWCMSTILGLFPPASLNALLGPDEVDAAMKRKPNHDDYNFSQKRMGVDVARFGDDRTIIMKRQGLLAYPCVEMRNARSNEVAARVLSEKKHFESEMDFIDDTGGFGSGVVDSLIQAGQSPQAINFSSKPINSKYFNKRAEMWFEMAEWIKRGGALPNDKDLARELIAPTYTFKNGKLALEEKDQIKARLRFSPDKADALALTFALPEMPGSAGIMIPGMDYDVKKMRSDYDPLASDRY